ncbi:MAG TPA: OmpA family protein, partial [Burkholderiaceae bacterium]|nr:OmpA family protein [Burkholderiaceae bacterium]
MDIIFNAAVAIVMATTLILGLNAPKTTVILLPQADGSPSAVEVKTTSDSQVLQTPYQRATAKSGQALAIDALDKNAVADQYPSLFSAMPAPAKKFVLNFMPGGTELTPASKAALPDILADANNRSGADLVVTGHTDTTGALLANDALSLKRAEVVTKLLVESGAPAARIESVGRGKRELL